MEDAFVDSAAKDLLASPEFRRLVARRWRVSLVLTAVLFVVYYGYILLIATDKALLAQRIGEATTLGIPLGAAVILGAWLLTASYVIWANRHYDREVTRLRDHLHAQSRTHASVQR
jgi:uncharacterized membrane protein (DUF485 family)